VSVFASYTLEFALQLRKKHGKTSVRLVEKCQLDTIHCVNMAALRVARTSCRCLFPCFSGLGSTLDQRRCNYTAILFKNSFRTAQ